MKASELVGDVLVYGDFLELDYIVGYKSVDAGCQRIVKSLAVFKKLEDAEAFSKTKGGSSVFKVTDRTPYGWVQN